MYSGRTAGIGGIDFDDELHGFVRSEFQKRFGLAVVEDSWTLQWADNLKKELSQKKERTLRLTGITPDGRLGGRQELEITRGDFESTIEKYLDKIELKCRDVMTRCEMSPRSIRDVILVGGSTRIPIVKERIDSIFECQSKRSPNCDEAVALGAGIYAFTVSHNRDELPITESQSRTLVDVTEILHRFYGMIALGKSRNKKLAFWFPKGTRVPTGPKQFNYHTNASADKCRVGYDVEWSIVESEDGDSRYDSTNWNVLQVEKLTIDPEATPSWPKGGKKRRKRKLTATVECDGDKVLHCKFRDDESGKASETITIPVDREISD